MDSRARMMMEALRSTPMGYAEGGLVNEQPLSLAPLTSAPNAFAPSLVNPMYAGVNESVAAFQAQQPVYGSAPLTPRAERPTFGAGSPTFSNPALPTDTGAGTGTYNFVAPVPQVQAPSATDGNALDFYTRQAQLQEDIRAAQRAQNQSIRDALIQTQAAQRSAASGTVGGGSSGAAGGGSTFAENAANITRLYQEILGRDPDPTGFAAYRGLSDDVIREGLLSSPEYKSRMEEKARNEAQQKAAAGSGGIASLYQELLGRAPDPSGLSAYKNFTDAQIRQAILSSPEYLGRTSGPTGGGIESIYQQLLGRAPDPSGIASNAGRTDEQIRQAILQSPEYRASPAAAAAAPAPQPSFVTTNYESGEGYYTQPAPAAPAAAPAPERQFVTTNNESGAGYYTDGAEPAQENTWYAGDGD